MTARQSAAEGLRRMAEYIREHGFDPEPCGCFIHARAMMNESVPNLAMEMLRDVIGGVNFMSVIDLNIAGWTAGCTDDAAAACSIAADIIEAGG